MNRPSPQRGDIAIFTALIMVTIMLSGAMALGVILSLQIPATFGLQHSEQAFYAASSGTEQVFFDLSHGGVTDVLIEREFEYIPYADGDQVQFYGQIVSLQGCTTDEDDSNYSRSCVDGSPCGVINGEASGIQRRLARGVPEIDCPDTLTVGD